MKTLHDNSRLINNRTKHVLHAESDFLIITNRSLISFNSFLQIKFNQQLNSIKDTQCKNSLSNSLESIKRIDLITFTFETLTSEKQHSNVLLLCSHSDKAINQDCIEVCLDSVL